MTGHMLINTEFPALYAAGC